VLTTGLRGEGSGQLEARADDMAQGLLPLVCSASIQGLAVPGELPGARITRLRTRLQIGASSRELETDPSGEVVKS
jgi:hypothetical protein